MSYHVESGLNISEWLRCPECGCEDVSVGYPDHHLIAFECQECGQEADYQI